MSTVTAEEFEARCLELVDEVARTREEVVVTRDGRPTARLVPFDGSPPRALFGRAAHTVVYVAEDAFAPLR